MKNIIKSITILAAMVAQGFSQERAISDGDYKLIYPIVFEFSVRDAVNMTREAAIRKKDHDLANKLTHWSKDKAFDEGAKKMLLAVFTDEEILDLVAFGKTKAAKKLNYQVYEIQLLTVKSIGIDENYFIEKK